MFKNIQKYLLINQPLLWNLKIVPASLILLSIDIIFFILGYLNGSIDFHETNDSYGSNTNEGIIIFFSVLVSILSTIIWIVYYFKNNALKSFYPKNNFSLFKEWLLILLICFLNCTYIIAFNFGKDTRVRGYYTESEAKKRCETLSQGSFFIEGSYSQHYNNDNAVAYPDDMTTETVEAVVDSVKPKDHFYYRGNRYLNFSLIDKNINSYSFFDFKEDSLRKIKIKDWLIDNKKEEIRTIFKNYLAIAKEHNLKANIDQNKWLDLIYDYPKFEKYKNVGNQEFEVSYDYNSNGQIKIDSTEQYYKTVKGTTMLFNRYYVPEKQLNYAYDKIAQSWNNPSTNLESFLIAFFVSIGLSLLLFSFRVTSGKNWLIAVVSLGIINIVVGIISAFASSEYFYFGIILLLFIALFIYFLVVISNKKGKGISGITLNALLWILPFFGPLLYALVLKIAKEVSGYNLVVDIGLREKQFPFITFLKEYGMELLWLNVLFIFIMMCFLSRKIKQWRGIAEG
ncbi:hypothetical protein [Flavobacterium sp.]|uniref:hypothetical protein n=1 Tax=Flavobacterium sp. TaxID=239 RepID=UPI003751B18B